jgi:hypothetical protein
MLREMRVLPNLRSHAAHTASDETKEQSPTSVCVGQALGALLRRCSGAIKALLRSYENAIRALLGRYEGAIKALLRRY